MSFVVALLWLCGCARGQVLFDLSAVSAEATFGGFNGASDGTVNLNQTGLPNTLLRIDNPQNSTVSVHLTAPFLRGRFSNSDCRITFSSVPRVDGADMRVTTSVRVGAGNGFHIVVFGLFAVVVDARDRNSRSYLIVNHTGRQLDNENYEPLAEGGRYLFEVPNSRARFDSKFDSVNVTVVGKPPLFNVTAVQFEAGNTNRASLRSTFIVNSTMATRIQSRRSFQLFSGHDSVFEMSSFRVDFPDLAAATVTLTASDAAVPTTALTLSKTTTTAQAATLMTAETASTALTATPFAGADVGPNVGLIAGAVGGAAAALLLVGGVAFFVWRARKASAPEAASPAGSELRPNNQYGKLELKAPANEYYAQVKAPANQYEVGNLQLPPHEAPDRV